VQKSRQKKPAKKKIVKQVNSESLVKPGQAEMLLNVVKTLASFDSLKEVFDEFVDMLSEAAQADRVTIFLHDKETGELYSRIAQGDLEREIRILTTVGVAGHVFTTAESMLVHDVSKNRYFDPSVDKGTGYTTRNILCVPIMTSKGDTIGVAQLLNKKKGKFTRNDLGLVEALTTQAAVVIQSILLVEQMEKSHEKEMEFFNVVSDVMSEIDLGAVLNKVMAEATRMLNADRGTLFLNDEKGNELFSIIGAELGKQEIRFPNHLGIAGTVFQSGRTVNIPHAYADLRFNPSFDKKTGFFTRSILCAPVVNKKGKTIGVTQVLNKHGGPFTDEDAARLKAFTAQVAIAMENAKLFDDIQNMRNYSEGILKSMASGVITLNGEEMVITCNDAGLKIMKIYSDAIVDKKAEQFFAGSNEWVMDRIRKVAETKTSDITMDAELEFNGETVSVNLTVLPLTSVEDKTLGTMIMMEDISNEKRMKSTMSRYMDAGLAEQLMDSKEEILGGKSTVATVLFSDIRGFTPLTEELGAQGTVSLLNEYFTIMVDCIQQEGGMLDKFIGDAIMAAFGIPLAHGDDEDRAMRAAISMLTQLNAWNVERIAHGRKPVKMGIGLNTDKIVSGNIGSPKRMDYTLIGDGVNLASRLESACKQYSAQILISENTFAKLRGTYSIREIDRVVVKGKTEPVAVYEVLDYHSDETFPNMMEVVGYFKSGVKKYRQQKWESAMDTFKECLSLNPDDRLSEIYIDRCKILKKKSPGDDWDGVWVMKSK